MAARCCAAAPFLAAFPSPPRRRPPDDPSFSYAMSEVSSANAQSSSSQTFITALVTNLAILGIELVAFVALRRRLTRIYEPRTYLPPPEYVSFCLRMFFEVRL